jgi:hypothetical protein
LWRNHWPSLGWARGIGRPCDGPGCNQATRPGYLHETASLALLTSNEAVLRTARYPEAWPHRDVRMSWTVDRGWRPVWHVARPSTEAQVLKALDRVLRRSRWATPRVSGPSRHACPTHSSRSRTIQLGKSAASRESRARLPRRLLSAHTSRKYRGPHPSLSSGSLRFGPRSKSERRPRYLPATVEICSMFDLHGDVQTVDTGQGDRLIRRRLKEAASAGRGRTMTKRKQ